MLRYRQMTWRDVNLVRDVDGTEYLEYSVRQTEMRSVAEP